MSTKPETTFYTSVHKHLPPPSELYREKMSNPYRAGGADFWYSGNKRDLWVEWKFVVLPKRDDTPIRIDLSPLQREWLRRRHEEGRNVAVIVGCKEGGVAFRECNWEGTPLTCAAFKLFLQPRAELANWIRDFTLGFP